MTERQSDREETRAHERRANSEAFLRRLLARRPQDRARYEALLPPPPVGRVDEVNEDIVEAARARVLEAIIDEERPVLFVHPSGLDFKHVHSGGPEAEHLLGELKLATERLAPHLSRIGRIDLEGGGSDWLATGWFFDEGIVVTNRHVAQRVAERRNGAYRFLPGASGPVVVSLGAGHHAADERDPGATYPLEEVLYIEPEDGPNDIALLRVGLRISGNDPGAIPLSDDDATRDAMVCVIGYPAAASRRLMPDQALMRRLYRERYNVKRVAPGYVDTTAAGVTYHDCTTLGGNSGSVLVDLKTGKAVGLHFAGTYRDTNYAVSAKVLAEYKSPDRWRRPYEVRATGLSQDTTTQSSHGASAPPAMVATSSVRPGGPSFTVQVPITITLTVGSPAPVDIAKASAPVVAAPRAASIDDAVEAYWASRPTGVVAARVGFLESGGAIGDTPCIAASVLPSAWGALEDGEFQGHPLRFFPATAAEQFDARGMLEGATEIRYDDDARTGAAFSFATVNEEMEVIAHVGPEWSWDTLHAFLKKTKKTLVSSMYEFHAPHIKDAIEERLEKGVDLTLVLDGKSFTEVKDEEEEFDRREVFDDWTSRFGDKFTRVVVPMGSNGLISSAYHIKVSVREDDTFWLSSGNWKAGSSQPIVTDEMRVLAEAQAQDLPGNREWHVVIKNSTLAERFRSHIIQDYARSTVLGGRASPEERVDPEEEVVDEVVEALEWREEAFDLERRPPSRLLKPLKLARRVKVKPLLTPDEEGAVYSDAVLALIQSAKRSLLFQIPYIAMPSNPRSHRGYIDDLLAALVDKLKTLDDARVLLRSSGSKLSAPTHAAWYFKSKGVDIDARLRSIENHHTKGMIVDGKRVLVGSHNWSAPGVSLNRDASLLFDDKEIAAYYADAFQIDWERSNPIRPKKFVPRPRGGVNEGVGEEGRAGWERVSLRDVLDEG